ncbi:hypothetical protein EG327_007359 [Venturia inaequalis]|uniref:Uncharacterized protein n=1 Tax=Venturia inaequalis TaxID=5025 RepID=A0A8H3VM93_VENIN|nr:hypothetical protein EG327_007359 [Venturia inaequalis]
MFTFRLQAPRITKREAAWKRSKGGRLQSRRRRPLPLKHLSKQKVKGVEPSPHYLPATAAAAANSSSDTDEPFSPPLSATLSEFLPAYAGEDVPPFDAAQFSYLHPLFPPPRYRHQIVQYFIGTNPMERPRRIAWSSLRKKRNPKYLELVSSRALLDKTTRYLDNLLCEERGRIVRAMEVVKRLGMDAWGVRWCAGFGRGEGVVGLVKEDVYVYEGDLVLEGGFWEVKRAVVMKCAVLEELICLAQEIEGSVKDVMGNEEEYGDEWYEKFWRERTF